MSISKHNELSRAWGKNIYYVSASSLDYDNVIFTNQNSWGGHKTVDLIDIKTRKLVLPPYKIMALGNKKVAFIGATTPQTLTSSTPV